MARPLKIADKTSRVLIACAVLVLILVVSSRIAGDKAVDEAALRIMPLGDSITQGKTHSYRRPLWLALRAAGISADFVGTQQGTRSGNERRGHDRDHEGHWGWRADQVLQRIDGWASQAKPDIVLMHLGTNDIYRGQSIAGTIDEIDRIIERLREHNPQVQILLAAIIPLDDQHTTSRIKAFNAALAELAASRDAARARVLLVDQFSGFDARGDTVDGVHPNERGGDKMAARWLSGIESLLQ